MNLFFLPAAHQFGSRLSGADEDFYRLITFTTKAQFHSTTGANL